MEENFHYDKLVLLNNIYRNSLVHDSTTIQPTTIKTPLYSHQQTMVQGMHAYRDKMTHGFLVGNQAINGKVGIIGNSPGTGKTLSTLAYLATHKTTSKMTCELTPHSSRYFFSHDIYQVSEAPSANLIIVPHSLFSQWRNEIEQHTTMKYIPIETKKMMKTDELTTKITSSSFVLTTNKCYKFVQDYATQNNIQWNNVFIDEASSIYINSSDPPLRFQFLWFITNNWYPLIFKNPSINKGILYVLKNRVDLHPELDKWLVDNDRATYESTLVSSSFLKEYIPFFHPHRSYMVLRNSIADISSSIHLPPMTMETLNCKPHLSLQSLTSFYLARNIEPHIKSKNIPHLFQALGIEFTDSNQYIHNQQNNKHNMIRRKVEENECVICLEQCEYPTIVNCCYHMYCGKCLLKNTLMHYKCPTCREILGISNICCLTSLEKDHIMIARTKSEICLDLFKENKDNKFIIYSAFDNIYYQLFEEIDKLGLKAERIESNLFSLLKTIKKFKEGTINILFISNIDLIRGISLPSTSHLIFYHEQPVYELKQILIHSSQRIGRSRPLKIIHLNSEIQV